jgi:hypothetical protein
MRVREPRSGPRRVRWGVGRVAFSRQIDGIRSDLALMAPLRLIYDQRCEALEGLGYKGFVYLVRRYIQPLPTAATAGSPKPSQRSAPDAGVAPYLGTRPGGASTTTPVPGAKRIVWDPNDKTDVDEFLGRKPRSSGPSQFSTTTSTRAGGAPVAGAARTAGPTTTTPTPELPKWNPNDKSLADRFIGRKPRDVPQKPKNAT